MKQLAPIWRKLLRKPKLFIVNWYIGNKPDLYKKHIYHFTEENAFEILFAWKCRPFRSCFNVLTPL